MSRKNGASPNVVEIQHVTMEEGRGVLSNLDLEELGIPSISPHMDQRWRAAFKGRFLDPGDNEKFLLETANIITSLTDVTTQRAVYYAIRGAHPKWRYKGEPLGDEFYSHFVAWVMEKLQLRMGMTMQAVGVWAAPRGYIAGDGAIWTSRRGVSSLTAKPALGFDMADDDIQLMTKAKKVIHFEKDAGLDNLVAKDFPKYIEAIFSTSQGQLTEAANKFLRVCQDRGLNIYGVHDGDPSGIQMQLMYGMASKNNCYMPDSFYPALVKPLGFYPSVGEALGLPPEAVTTKEDGIFNNLLVLAEEKQRVFPELRRFGLDQELKVIIKDRLKWEFQALNALGEMAPKIYVLEGLRIHNDEIKHVPSAPIIKRDVIAAARESAEAEVEEQLTSLAKSLYEVDIKEKLVELLRVELADEISSFRGNVEGELTVLDNTHSSRFRELVKATLLRRPDWYAEDVIRRLGSTVLTAKFKPTAELEFSMSIDNVQVESEVQANPPERREPITRTELIDAIETKILKTTRARSRIVSLIRKALEKRFGACEEVW